GAGWQPSSCIAPTTGIETHVDDHVFDFREARAVAIFESETSLGIEGVLAEVALGSSDRFPAFDDLVTLNHRLRAAAQREGFLLIPSPESLQTLTQPHRF